MMPRAGPDNSCAAGADRGAQEIFDGKEKAEVMRDNIIEVVTKAQAQPVRRFVVSSTVPERALIWTTTAERRRAQARWKGAMIESSSLRVLKVAWALDGLLFGGKRRRPVHFRHDPTSDTIEVGYAFAGDGYLMKITKLHRTEVQKALLAMERASMIIRVHFPLGDGKFERRIFPALPFTHDATVASPPMTPLHTHHYGVTEFKGKPPYPQRLPNPRETARNYALAREGGRSARDLMDTPNALSNGAAVTNQDEEHQ